MRLLWRRKWTRPWQLLRARPRCELRSGFRAGPVRAFALLSSLAVSMALPRRWQLADIWACSRLRPQPCCSNVISLRNPDASVQGRPCTTLRRLKELEGLMTTAST